MKNTQINLNINNRKILTNNKKILYQFTIIPIPFRAIKNKIKILACKK